MNQPILFLLSCVFKSSVYFRRKGGFAVNLSKEGVVMKRGWAVKNRRHG